MNLSHVSDYENCEPVVFENGDEALDLIINDILKLLQNTQPVTYCAFCVQSFPDNQALRNHLRLTHSAFLWELTSRSIRLDACPLCCAKFVGHHLVAKHALHFHGNVLADAFFEKCGSTVKCAFCHSIIITKNILAHLEEWHTLQFIEWFIGKFKIRQEGVSGLVDTAQSVRVDVDDLNEHLQNLQVMSSPKSILKTEKPVKPPVRRVLSFADDDKENQSVRKKIKSPNGRWSGALRSSSIECGKCALMFPTIKLLEVHIKKEHKKIPGNLLQRFYKCSQCGANFFKRSYLRKHVAGHSLTKFR